jgi:hypothetical protein
MKPDSPPFPGTRPAALLAAGLIAALFLSADVAPPPALAGGDEPATPSFDKQVNLVYTVNNFGYTDVCG